MCQLDLEIVLARLSFVGHMPVFVDACWLNMGDLQSVESSCCWLYPKIFYILLVSIGSARCL